MHFRVVVQKHETFNNYPLVNIQKNYGKSPFSMGKSTISMAIFNSYVSLPEGAQDYDKTCHLFGSLLHIGTFLVSPRHSKQGLMIRSPKLEMENKRDIVRFPQISIIRLMINQFDL